MKTAKGIDIPADLAEALEAEPEIMAVLERMRPSCQREYADWVDDAKKPDTRVRRIDSVRARIVEWGQRHQLLPEV